MATKKQKPFDIGCLTARIIARFHYQFRMEATRQVYVSECDAVLGDLNPTELEIAYDRTVKTWRGTWAPRALEILDNAPVPFVANAAYKYDRDLREYVKDNHGRIERSFRQTFAPEIQKAEDNGWRWSVDDIITHLASMQAWFDFDKKSFDISTPEHRIVASKYVGVGRSHNPGRSGEDTFMHYVNNKPKAFRPQ